jgi:hypothetical protein
MYVILDTGTDYFYLDTEGEWSENAQVAINVSFGGQFTSSRKWQTVSVTSNPIPEMGTVIFSLYPWAESPSSGSRDTQFKNLRVSFKPPNEDGQQATVSQQIDIKEDFDGSIKMGDPTSPTVNGAFLQTVPDDEMWVDWTQWGEAGVTHLTEILARDLFRARKRLRTKVEGTIKGITVEMPQNTDRVGILSPNWQVQYGALAGYVYLPTGLELNIEADTARMYLYEFYHSTFDNANEEGDDQEFKYLK